jgi:hypothetical protein
VPVDGRHGGLSDDGKGSSEEQQEDSWFHGGP